MRSGPPRWADGRPLRLNLGSGPFRLSHDAGWLNVDADARVGPDVCCAVPPLPWATASVAEVYLGHLLEHHVPAAGAVLLQECYRVLAPGGRCGVTVPDTRAIMHRWLGEATTTAVGPDGQVYRVADLNDVCAYWLFSTYQPSPHRWAYDGGTLAAALRAAGFVDLRPIDRFADPRLANPAWDTVGWDGYKPAA